MSFFKTSSKGKNIRKRPSGKDEENEDDNIQGNSMAWNKKKAALADNKLSFSTASSNRGLDWSPIFQFGSCKEIQVQNDNIPTATLETETEYSKGARAIRERALKQAGRGIHGYTDYKARFGKEQTVASEKGGRSHGPLWGSAHIGVSTQFDYQPNVFKDYKITGYCGYGDSCKFIHDRGDYKLGWQIEKERDEAEKKKQQDFITEKCFWSSIH